MTCNGGRGYSEIWKCGQVCGIEYALPQGANGAVLEEKRRTEHICFGFSEGRKLVSLAKQTHNPYINVLQNGSKGSLLVYHNQVVKSFH